jgi:hypothetical protein
VIAIISMFRNEESIAPFWARQVSALSDFSVLIDHRSTDGSADILKAIPQSAILKCEAAGHPQAAVMSAALQESFRLGAQWVIPLDLDEFIPFRTKEELSANLDKYSQYSALKWPWRNLCPAAIDSNFTLGQKFTFRHEHSEHWWKVIVNRKAFELDPNLTLSQGSHELNLDLDPFPMTRNPLRHIPVRSRVDWFAKIQQGGLAISEDENLVETGQGWHWTKHSLRTQSNNRKLRQSAWCYPHLRCKRLHSMPRNEQFDFNYIEPHINPKNSVLPARSGTIKVLGNHASITWDSC